MEDRSGGKVLVGLVLLLASFATPLAVYGQEVPLKRCDTLPVIEVIAAGRRLRFLVDTAATSLLNLKSFTQGEERLDVQVMSWTGSQKTKARVVTLDEVVIGSTTLPELKLPAIDLSVIGSNCGERIDGIFGADLLGRFGATIDMKQRTLRLVGEEQERDAKLLAEMQQNMHRCLEAFNHSDERTFGDCLDPKVALSTVDADLYGREQVLDYFRRQYFHQTPPAQLKLREHAFHAIGRAVWYEYEFSVESVHGTLHGRGMGMCRKSQGQWRMASIYTSVLEGEPASPTEP